MSTQVKLTPENIERGINAALSSFEKDWIRRSVKELLNAGKRDQALKFLRENLVNWGTAGPGEPYVHGSPKGILIQSDIMDPKETKLITWQDLLQRVQAEESKKLEEYFVPSGAPKPPPLPEVKPSGYKGFEIGDYVLYGSARVMVFDGLKDGKITLDDPFHKKGEYAFNLTPKEFDENVSRPTKQYATSEYERVKHAKPADFEIRLSKLPEEKPETVGEHAEKWSKEFEAAKAEAEERERRELRKRPPMEEVPRQRVEFPIKLIVGPGYDIEQYPKGVTITGETVPISITHRPNIGEVDDYVNQGKEELDLYEGLRQMGGDPKYILMGLQEWGMASYPQLAEVFKKVEEDRWEDITDEEETLVDNAWDEALKKEWVLTWTPADVTWEPAVLKDKEIYHSKYSYDQLMAMNANEVKNIARVKGVGTGRKDEMAQKIHSLDFGVAEAEAKIKDIDKLLG
jgi:hypothetical protein